MIYMGSKLSIAKEILPIILKDRKPEQWYVEPFVGGFNMIDKVTGNRIGNDIHYYLIELFKAIQKGWIPPCEISETEYYDIRENKNQYPPYLVGFVGFLCSYAGKWFDGYAVDDVRNYALTGRNALLEQYIKIKHIKLFNLNYRDLIIPDNSIVYCDPPYATKRKYIHKVNYELFWNWVRDISKNHQVFVSELTAPDDFKSIWKTDKRYSTARKTTNTEKEKLWIPKESVS